MNARVYIQHQLTRMRLLSDAVLGDTTDEQLNWTPPGTANPIKAPLTHLIMSEDRFIQTIIQGKPTIWEAEGWGKRVGLAFDPSVGQAAWDAMVSTPLTLAPLLDYMAAVRAATDAYITTLTTKELDRQVRIMGQEWPVADVLALLVVHVSGHIGEIAALKGMQGVKGLPF
jgi:hypothetical protein